MTHAHNRVVTKHGAFNRTTRQGTKLADIFTGAKDKLPSGIEQQIFKLTKEPFQDRFVIQIVNEKGTMKAEIDFEQQYNQLFGSTNVVYVVGYPHPTKGLRLISMIIPDNKF